MSGYGGGGARAGCGIFGLVGVLVSVGLVVWLASNALQETPGGKQPRPDDPAGLVVPGPPDTSPADPLAVTITPAENLDEGATVTVATAGLPNGATATVTTCLANGGPVVTEASCDPETTTTATADQNGRLTVEYQPARVVGTGLAPFDCAEDPGTCVVRVIHGNEHPATGSAPIGYRSDLPAPTLPGLPGG